MMSKTTFGAALAFLAAAAGVLAAIAIYLYRREKELDEYEELLFSDDIDEFDDADEEETIYEELDGETPDENAAAEPTEEPAAEDSQEG